MREAIVRVVSELETEHTRQWELERKISSNTDQWYRQGGQDGLQYAIKKLKEVLAQRGTDDGGRVPGNVGQEAKQIRSETNRN